jgi:hypothetical protein
MGVAQNDRFYAELGTFDRFGDFVDFEAYAPVPADWVVVISDVVGSTKAIAEGRYKHVNMVGAASITAVLNACGDVEVPYMFGGDGGTLVVPGSLAARACKALTDLQVLSRGMFGLGLRAGAVPVADLRAGGHDLRIRKYALSPGNHLAMFAGGGMEEADRLLKDSAADNPYVLAADPNPGEPDLDGLSCRWEPLVARNGRMMSLMVQGLVRDPAQERRLLDRVLGTIGDILGHGLKDAAPASAFSMRFSWPPSGLALEARATRGAKSFARRYAEVLFTSLAQLWCERFDRRAGPYDAPAYRAELRANTDFCKYDGILRTVLDVTQVQAELIERHLEREYRDGRLVWGMHLADTALMTCLVFSLESHEHVHFIDGSDGGFAMAAVGFKERLRAFAARGGT